MFDYGILLFSDEKYLSINYDIQLSRGNQDGRCQRKHDSSNVCGTNR